MSSILLLWEEMAAQANYGLVKRLFKRTSAVIVYATYNHISNVCGIAISYNRDINVNVAPFSGLSELKVEIYNDQANKLLTIQLTSDSNKDVFAVLCDNLIQTIDNCITEREALQLVLNRLEKWKSLLKKGAAEGLAKNEQQGLYGELVYLNKLIDHCENSFLAILGFWVGIDKAMRDFQGDGWATEVKTVSTNTPYQITINGERQLDETLLKKLYLYHLIVEVSQGNGETLNEKIEKTRRKMQDNLPAMTLFNSKLMEAGYFDHHKVLYEERCYMIRNENLYQIRDNFPRIKENELRLGVSNTEYSINISNCNEYKIEESEHYNNIK